MEISNKLLVTLLVVAIVVSVGGAILNMTKLSELARVVPVVSMMTGAGTSGTVNITLISQAEVNISTYQVEFGAGYVVEGLSARLETNGSTTNWSGSGSSSGLVLENTGNVNITVNFSSSAAAAAFIGADATFMYNVTSDEADACFWNGTHSSPYGNMTGDYTEVTTATQKVCLCLRDEAANDQLSIAFRVLIPETATPGAKNATLTFTSLASTGACVGD